MRSGWFFKKNDSSTLKYVYDRFMANWQLFIRHAHRDINRDTVDRDLDNGLSDKGRLQAEELVKYLKLSHPDRKPLRVLSSVKLRCWQTAEYVARWAGVEVIEDPRLVERGPAKAKKIFWLEWANL